MTSRDIPGNGIISHFTEHIDEGERDVAATTSAQRLVLNPIANKD